MKLTILAIALLLTVQSIGVPVVAAATIEECESSGVRYNCITEEIRVREIHPVYDNGLAGNVNASNYTAPHETWPTTLRGVTIPDGVVVAPSFESLARVFAAYNGTAQYNSSAKPLASNELGLRSTDSVLLGFSGPAGSIRLLDFTVNFPESIIMNGASSFYYRSPLDYGSNYTHHWLNIVDDAGRLVAARHYPSNANDSELVDGRLYYRIDAMLESSRNYSVQEYVRTDGHIAMDHLDLFIAPGQDVDGGGATSARIFPREQAERVISEDVAFSFRFVHGMGPGGTMNLIPISDTTVSVALESGTVQAANLTAGSDEMTIVIPIQTTIPLNGSVQVFGGTSGSVTVPFALATGTIILKTNVSGFAGSDLSVTVTLEPSPTATCPAGAYDGCGYISYPMFQTADEDESVHAVTKDDGFVGLDNVITYEWEPWIEVKFEDLPSPILTAQDASVKEVSRLSPLGLILAGVLFLGAAIVSIPVSVPLAIGLAAVSTATILFGVITASPEDLAQLAEAAKLGLGVAALAACGGAYLAPGISNKLILGGTCLLLGSLATDNLPGLLDFILRIPEVIQKAIEMVGHFVASVAEWGAPLLVAILVLMLIFVLLGVFVVPIKYVVMGITGIIAVILYEKATDWSVYRRARNIPIPLFTQLVENKMFGMKVPV